MRKIRFGVLGVSNHLTKRIVLPMQDAYNCHIIGIASRNKNKAEKFANDFGINKVYSDYDQLLQDNEIDAVYIPLPNHLHVEWIKRSAEAGKHIICEKPISIDSQSLIDILEFVEKKNVKLMEAFMYKFHPQWIHSKNIVRTNQIGKIQYIHTSFAYNNPDKSNIRNIKELGGGAIMDIGCYATSVPRYILEKEPIKVVSSLKFAKDYEVDTLSSGILDFGDAISTFSISMQSHPNQRVEIVGTSGFITIHIPFNTYSDSISNISISTPQGSRTISFDKCDHYKLMFEAFSDTIINNKELPIPMIDSINNMKAIDAIFKSFTSKQWEKII